MIKSWVHKNIIDNNTRNWRVRLIDKKLKRWYWKVRFALHYFNREEVDAISIVVVGRNDNYGGDFSQRLKVTIDWNYKNLPNAELIYVEWNQIPDRPSDTEWISKRYPNSKCLIVPNEVHLQYATNPNIKMMEYVAKNIGIRNATNKWIAIINADVLLAENTLKNLKKLNKNFVYGSQYINIKWHGEDINVEFLNRKDIFINSFSTNLKMYSVVGNFILMHRDNWFKMGGYDETLKNVRAGVDNNGLAQILYHGVQPMVIGDHYHLDHAESLIKGKNNTHGKNTNIDNESNIPYNNDENWGLTKHDKLMVSYNTFIFN